jgi:hypothetical protein
MRAYWDQPEYVLFSHSTSASSSRLGPILTLLSHREQEAFILNLASHWFTIRRFGSKPNRWYNLNSFFPTPQCKLFPLGS